MKPPPAPAGFQYPGRDDATEAYRYDCEVRHVARLPDKEARREYLAGVARFRGQAAADAIIAGLRELYRRTANP